MVAAALAHAAAPATRSMTTTLPRASTRALFWRRGRGTHRIRAESRLAMDAGMEPTN